MKFVIRNQAKISNKYVRFAKWKIRKLSRKFGEALYSEIYIKQISATPALYAVTIKMGIPGPDIIVSAQSSNLRSLWSDISQKLKRQMRNTTSKKNQK